MKQLTNVLNMKVIQIKSIMKTKYLRDHIFNIFRTHKFNSQYIDIIVKISGDKDSIFYSLGKIVTLDLNNMDEKTNYVNHVTSKFSKLGDEYGANRTLNNKLIIYFYETNLRGYNKNVRNINLSNKNKIETDDGILPVNNLPFNKS